MWLLLTIGVLAALILLSKLLRRLRWLLRIGALVLAVTVISGAAACWSAPDIQTESPDYAVLLGCSLEDGKPTDEMVRRMNLALDWLGSTKDTVLMVSGGDVLHDGVSEADVMYQWLSDRGADMSRIIAEPYSADTRENLLNCKEIAQNLGIGTDNVLILSSDYHQTRARFLAEKLGQTASGLSCETPFLKRLSASVREVYSFVKAFYETL